MKRRPSGFTLVELLVVIAIVVLLAAVMFPVFTAARERARQSTCASNLKQLGLATLQYTSDNDGFTPGAYSGRYPTNTTAPLGGWIYYSQYATDAPNQADFVPSMGSLYPYVRNADVYRCPDDPVGKATGDSYAINACVENPVDSESQYASGRALGTLANPTMTMLFGEENDDGIGSTSDGYLSLTTINTPSQTATQSVFLNFNFAQSTSDSVSDRHNSGTEVVFLDGHAAWWQTDSIHVDGLQTGVAPEYPGSTVCP